MFIGFFDFCQELMSGYKIWLIFTVILCMILLKFGYAFMLEMLKTFLGTLIMVVIGIVMVIVAFMVYLGNVGYGNRHR